MNATHYEIRLCETCGLRYPRTDTQVTGIRCPLCLGTTRLILTRRLPPSKEPLPAASSASAPRLEALLDNLRSAWNVGAIFRSADGLGVNKLHLCGITPTPENQAVAKTALGAEKSVTWQYARNALEQASQLKANGFRLIALEQDERAIPLSHYPLQSLANTLFIVGNEVTGVDPGLLDLCDHILHIPMLGSKRSLNVEVAFGIAAYALQPDTSQKETP
ncbi:MAG: hypothetical protein Fur0043_04420 [Anaerolineales bacterium]